SAVVITIELVEKGAPRLLDLVKIEGAVVVRVEFLYRAWASRLSEGRQAGAHATENQDIQKCCASRYHLDILLWMVDPADPSSHSVIKTIAYGCARGMTTRPPCRVIILKRGDFIASSALRPRRAHSSRNKRSAKAPKYFARRKRTSWLITSVNVPNPPRPPASPPRNLLLA